MNAFYTYLPKIAGGHIHLHNTGLSICHAHLILCYTYFTVSGESVCHLLNSTAGIFSRLFFLQLGMTILQKQQRSGFRVLGSRV